VQEQLQKSEGPTPRGTNITTNNFSANVQNVMYKPANEAGLMYSVSCGRCVCLKALKHFTVISFTFLTCGTYISHGEGIAPYDR
jgi:hypothetical protein